MENETVFYILGIALFALALVVSFLGIRSERFPPSTAVLGGIVAVFVGLIGATAAFAIAAAKDEQEHREAELAAEEHGEEAASGEAPGEGEAAAEAEQEIESPAPDEVPGGDAPAAGAKKPGQKKPAEKAPAGAKTTIELAADPTQLAFDTTSLSAPPGEVTINLDNPAAIPHNVAVASEGDVIAESDTVTESQTSVSTQLEPGDYEFLCTVPGHAEAGMQGTLSVK
jgi:plastocyanin